MLDLLYLAVTAGFFIVCWLFTKACDKL